jgi:hypothetical protein
MSRLGEDIRHAKAIYELAYSEQNNDNVNEWMRFARYCKKVFKVETYQQLTTLLEIKVNRLQTT